MRSVSLRLRAVALLCLVPALVACATATSLIQSPNDDRHYEHIVLPNGLSAVLISDPGADKAAAALAVGTGSFEDPRDRAGLAHFLEHMLFLGTQKYPATDEYQQYISSHGGTHNAYTAGDHTNFFFDIEPGSLEGALDRFAQFFISPRLDAEYVDREKNAVNSEYQLYLKDDGWRGAHVNKLAMNPAHPGSDFNVGSLQTLAGDVQPDLLHYYQQHYSADLMDLVVLGPQPLDQLRTWVTAMFAAVPRHETVREPKLPPLYAAGALPAQISYQTIKDVRLLNFNFPVPSLDPYFRQKPGEFIANLLGHEGEGSLHAWLKSRGWIDSLSAAADRFDAQNGVVTVAIELTAAGAEHEQEIRAAFFDYVALIREHGLERWRYEEQARIAQLSFRFQEQQSPLVTVYQMAPNMRLYPAREVLAAPYLMTRWDETLVRRYLDALRPDNVLVEVANRDVKGDAVEPWFQVPYTLTHGSPMPAPAAAVAGLALPPPNPFLPERLDLLGQFDEKPTRAIAKPGLELWLARDTSFGVPRANTYLQIAIDGGVTSTTDVLNATLYARLVQDRLNTFAYPAEIAGLDYAIGVNARGFLVTISGFDDKQPLLLERLLEGFATLAIDDDRFALYRDALARELLNSASERPYEQAMAGISHLLVENAWPPALLDAAIDGVTKDGLEAWRKDRLQRVAVTALLHGNVDPEAARKMAHVVAGHLPLAALERFEPRVAKPAGDLRYALTIDNTDAALVYYVQGRNDSFAERARIGLAAQIVGAPYFNDLRTEQQLGYAVFAGPALLRSTPGIAFTVQSPVAGPDALQAATEKFLANFRATLAAMPAQEFANQKLSLATKLLEKDKNLASRGTRYWSDLDLGFTTFDSREQIAAAVAAIDQADFLAFYDDLIARAAQQRVIVYSPGKYDTVPTGADVGDVAAFKRAVTKTESPAGTPAAPPATSARSAQ